MLLLMILARPLSITLRDRAVLTGTTNAPTFVRMVDQTRPGDQRGRRRRQALLRTAATGEGKPIVGLAEAPVAAPHYASEGRRALRGPLWVIRNPASRSRTGRSNLGAIVVGNAKGDSVPLVGADLN